jgi:GT2 family glycosyltransferase
MSYPLVISVILNTNHKDDTLECLESLKNNSYPNQKVIVLDNHSTDGSTTAVREAYPDVHIVELDENLGYAGNNNVGIQAAMDQGADWIFVLNEDVILDSECIMKLMEGVEKDSRVGIAGPLVYHYDEPNVIQSAGGALGKYWESIHIGQNELDRGQFNMTRPVDWISGCAILVRRTAIEQAGLLDKNYFIYWEETEWCIRASKAGWLIYHVPQAKLWHKGVQRNYQPKPYVTYYVTRNRLFTLVKHHAPLMVWFVAFLQIFRTLLSWSIKPKWRSLRKHRNAMWKGLVDFLQHRLGPMPS